jgi:hypothetical protein
MFSRPQQSLAPRQERLTGRFLMALLVANLLFGGKALAEGVTTTVEVPAAIRAQLDKLVSAQSPSPVLRRISGSVQTGSGSSPVERFFERLDSGLWGVTTAIMVRGALVRNALTLHGLVELTATSTIDRDFKIDAIIPIGKLFVPYGQNKNLKANGVIAITSLGGDLDALSAPAAGGKFSYSRSAIGQNTVTTTGMFGGTRTHKLEVEFKADCSAGPEADASSLNSQLRGKYLPVKCEGKTNGSARADEFIYLVDSKLYVLLSSGNDKFNIEKVEYAP